MLDPKCDKSMVLEIQRRLLNEQAEELSRARACLELLIDDKPIQQYEAIVKKVDKCLVYCCRGYINSIKNIHDFVKASSKELTRTNPDVKFPPNDYCCIIYPEDIFRESNVFVEYVQSVDRMGQNTEIIKFKELDPIVAISVCHHGKYENLRDAYLFAIEYAKEKGRVDLAEKFYQYFTEGKWVDSKGNKVKNWKQKFLTWCSYGGVQKERKKDGNFTGREYKEELGSMFQSIDDIVV